VFYGFVLFEVGENFVEEMGSGLAIKHCPVRKMGGSLFLA
jgi:hypothetical protein